MARTKILAVLVASLFATSQIYAQAPAAASQAISDFIYEAERGNQVNKLRAMANKAEDAASTILWKALLNVLNSPLTKDQQKLREQFPGVAFEREGCVRIGYANSPAILADGLNEVSRFLATLT